MVSLADAFLGSPGRQPHFTITPPPGCFDFGSAPIQYSLSLSFLIEPLTDPLMCAVSSMSNLNWALGIVPFISEEEEYKYSSFGLQFYHPPTYGVGFQINCDPKLTLSRKEWK